MKTKRFLIVAAASAALAAPALAQDSGGGFGIGKGGYGEIIDAQTVVKREKAKEVDRDYQATIRKIPDQKISNDPWGSVRQADKPAKSGR